MQERGDIRNLTVGICGDLKFGRTTHSLVEAMGMFPGVKFRLISPPELRMPRYALDLICANGQEYEESEQFAENIPDLDILYMTRIQRERFHSSAEYRRLKGVFVLSKKLMDTARSDMLVLHPLPRYGEILPEVDSDPRAVYFKQARYGMFIRMALLHEFLNLPRLDPPPVKTSEDAPIKCENPTCITQAEVYLPQITPSDVPNRCGYCDKDFPV
jgi:aspartate carbamoyltransferase catalytic subunit